MSMTPQDWTDLGSVYRAGAQRARGWEFNNDRQQDAEILEAQAGQCEEIARNRNGNPAVTHDHDHFHHPDGKHRYRHVHPHAHGDGENDHDGAHGHEHEPAGPLFPASWEDGFARREELR